MAASLLTREYVDGIAARYRGTSCAIRLLSLAAACPAEVAAHALQAAAAKLREGSTSTALYCDVSKRLAALAPAAFKADEAWIAATDAAAAARFAELEKELAQANSSAIRDSMHVRAAARPRDPTRATPRARGPPHPGPLTPRAQRPSLPPLTSRSARCLRWRSSTRAAATSSAPSTRR